MVNGKAWESLASVRKIYALDVIWSSLAEIHVNLSFRTATYVLHSNPMAKCYEKHLRATPAVAPDSSCRPGMQKCHHTEEFGGCRPPQNLAPLRTDCNFNGKKPSWRIKVDKPWDDKPIFYSNRPLMAIAAQLQHYAEPACTCKNPIYASWVDMWCI